MVSAWREGLPIWTRVSRVSRGSLGIVRSASERKAKPFDPRAIWVSGRRISSGASDSPRAKAA